MKDLKNGMKDRFPYLPNSESLILNPMTNHKLNDCLCQVSKLS